MLLVGARSPSGAVGAWKPRAGCVVVVARLLPPPPRVQLWLLQGTGEAQLAEVMKITVSEGTGTGCRTSHTVGYRVPEAHTVIEHRLRYQGGGSWNVS